MVLPEDKSVDTLNDEDTESLWTAVVFVSELESLRE